MIYFIIFCISFNFIPPAASNELGGILCRLPKNEGYKCGMTSHYAAFYFDFDIGECIEFIFQGCGGNQNRFSTKQDCHQGCKSLTQCGKGLPLMDFAGNIKRCEGDRIPCPGSHICVGHGMDSVCCQKADRICQSSIDAGTACGVPPTTRFYFDFSSKTCRPFAFTGCGGNENNFKSKGECMKFCTNEIICPKGDPHPDRYSINNIASCMEDKHCPNNYTCTGKSGKKGACCPSRELVCGSSFEQKSSCRMAVPTIEWTFDGKKGECRKIEYVSCEEQLNLFANQEQCMDYCIVPDNVRKAKSGSCPSNLEMHYNPNTGQPQLCDSTSNHGCPLGYECIKSTSFASVCCKTSPICPAAESILQIQDELAVRCEPNRPYSCPEQYSCQQAKNKEFICCTRPLSCPEGMKELRENGGRPRICSIGVEGNCPVDHICVAGEGSLPGGAKHLCCTPQKRCIVPYVDMETKRPKRCFPGDGTCGASTACLPALEDTGPITNAIDVMFFCCHTVDVFTCQDGSMPLIDSNTNKPVRCHSANPSSCPLEMECSLLMDGSHSCCPHPLSTQICLQAITTASGMPVKCKGYWDNSCSDGSRCRKAHNGEYFCCEDVVHTYQTRLKKYRTEAKPPKKINMVPANALGGPFNHPFPITRYQFTDYVVNKFNDQRNLRKTIRRPPIKKTKTLVLPINSRVQEHLTLLYRNHTV